MTIGLNPELWGPLLAIRIEHDRFRNSLLKVNTKRRVVINIISVDAEIYVYRIMRYVIFNRTMNYSSIGQKSKQSIDYALLIVVAHLKISKN